MKVFVIIRCLDADTRRYVDFQDQSFVRARSLIAVSIALHDRSHASICEYT
jgi:hypothetical protein